MTTTASIRIPRMTVEQGAALVARWRASGQRQSAFCATHAIHPERLSRWVRRLREPPGAEPTTSVDGFSLAVVGSGVRVRLACGAAIEVDAVFNAGHLRQVVEALC